MSSGLFNGDVPRSEWLPNYGIRRLASGKIILASPAGSWLAVSGEEFETLRGVAIERGLFSKLEEQGLVVTRHNGQRVFDEFLNGFTVFAYQDRRFSFHIGICLVKRRDICDQIENGIEFGQSERL